MALFLQMVGTVGILLAGVGLAYGSLEFYRLRHLLQTGALLLMVCAVFQPFDGFGAVDALRLKDRKPTLQRGLLHRRGCGLPGAPLRAVGLRDEGFLRTNPNAVPSVF